MSFEWSRHRTGRFFCFSQHSGWKKVVREHQRRSLMNFNWKSWPGSAWFRAATWLADCTDDQAYRCSYWRGLNSLIENFHVWILCYVSDIFHTCRNFFSSSHNSFQHLHVFICRDTIYIYIYILTFTVHFCVGFYFHTNPFHTLSPPCFHFHFLFYRHVKRVFLKTISHDSFPFTLNLSHLEHVPA